MNIAQGLADLARRGLNIFASAPVAELPNGLVKNLPPAAPGLSLGIFASGGTALWQNLAHPLNPATDPIDNYAKQLVREFLGESNVQIIYPDSRWLLPLQRLGRALDVARPSLLGMDIHPHYGLWFAYRVVFLTPLKLPAQRGEARASMCEACSDRPCQSVPPVGAAPRLACPVGREHRYSAEQIEYHTKRVSHLQRSMEPKAK